MNRKQFLGSLAGAIGVATSAKAIASIGIAKKVVSNRIPLSARHGDIFISTTSGSECYFFDGKRLRSVSGIMPNIEDLNFIESGNFDFVPLCKAPDEVSVSFSKILIK